MMAQRQGGMPPQQMQPRPPMPPQMQGGQPPMPQGSAPPPSQPGQTPPGGGGGIPPQIMQMLMQAIQQQKQQAPQQLAAQGRGGDSMIAHLTPGEIMVPPEVQTPKVLATLKKDFHKHGVSPQQFTAGSPASSTNPKTGVPEYNFMSAFLPAAMGVAGAVAAPFTGGASLGLDTAAMAALGSGVGTAAGGLIEGQSPTQALASGVGAGAGGYLLGGAGGQLGNLIGGSGSAAAGGAASSAATPAATSALDTSALSSPVSAQIGAGQGLGGAVGAGGAGATSASAASTLAPKVLGSQMLGSFNPFASAGGALGSYLGGQLGSTPNPTGILAHMPAIGSLGSAQQQLGMTNSNQPRPSFAGYNPATNNPAAYNFYPGSQG